MRAWILIISCVALGGWPTGAAAQSSIGLPVTLAWDANSETAVVGYRVFVGTSPKTYSEFVDVGRTTMFTYTRGIEGRRYYFAVAAYATGPLVGTNSTEVSTVVVPVPPPPPPVAMDHRVGVTVADLTLMRAARHAVYVAPETRNSYRTLLHNLRIVDNAGAFIGISPATGYYADQGVIEFSSLQLTDTGRLAVPTGCAVGGIVAAQARGWQVCANTLDGFWCASAPSDPASSARAAPTARRWISSSPAGSSPARCTSRRRRRRDPTSSGTSMATPACEWEPAIRWR